MLSPRKCWTEMDLLPLVCLCVLTWSRGTFADPDGPLITTITVNAYDDVVLPCSFGTSDIRNKYFDWKKDAQKDVFLYDSGRHYNNGLEGQDQDFKDRVSHFEDRLQSGNASIRINPVKVSDKGTYSCDFPSDGGIRSQIELVVECILKDRTQENIPGACPEPVVTLKKTNEGMQVQCHVERASTEPEVELWRSPGEVVHVPDGNKHVSQKGNFYNVILSSIVTQEGEYWCVVKQKEICHQISSKRTHVNIPGSCPQPSVTTIKTDEGVLLKCEVKHASPEPEVEWQDSDGNTVPSKDPQIIKNGNYSDIILLAAVIKEGDYQCVVKQTQICHQVHSEKTFVGSPGSQRSQDVTIGVIIGVVITAGLIVFLIFVLVKKGTITIRSRNGSERPRTGEIKELNSNRSDL